MKKLLDKNRKAQLMTKLHLSLQKYESYKQPSNLSQSQIIRQQSSNDQLSRQLSKLLQSNNRKKNDLKQKLISGPVQINLNEQMSQLKQRMNILRQHHRSQKNPKSYQSLIHKQSSDNNFTNKYQKKTFQQLYNIQKQKFSALRQKRKNKRLNLSYLETIANKQSRKQRNKMLIQQKFNQQMKLLDQAIGDI